MACGCATRMRRILNLVGYTLTDGAWTRMDHTILDSRIEEDHFRVLIETMEAGLFRTKAQLFTKRLRGVK